MVRKKQLTGICAVVGSDSDDLESKARSMLGHMRKRGSASRTFSQGVSQGRRIAIGTCEELGATSLESLSEQKLALDGVLFGDAERKADWKDPSFPGRAIQVPGAFSFLTLINGQLFVGRDIIGQKPLYFGWAEDRTIAFASLKAPLLMIGVRSPEPVSPGRLIVASTEQPVLLADHSLRQPKEMLVTESDAIPALKRLFTVAVRKIVPRGSGIAFSGGLDSALVAQVAKSNDLEPELISVGLKGQEELDHVSRIAKVFDLHVDIRELSSSEVLEALPEVVEMVESTDPVVVGVSVPIYFACKRAHELGLSHIAAGQLSDELFGGYGKFEAISLQEGIGKLGSEMWKSVVAASANDFDPGDKLAVSSGLELRCPFAYLPLVKYVLTLPVSLRVNLSKGIVTRKFILRKLAAHLGLPDAVVSRPKKAVQYSSGVQKVLLKEAKRRGVSLSSMLKSSVR